MKRILELIIQIFRFHKLKIVTIIGSALLFLVLFFPYSDLTDLVTQKILDATNNQVLFQAEKINLGFVPSPSLSGDTVSVDYGTLPTIEAKKLEISPSFFSLLGLALGSSPTSVNVTVDGEGLLGGNLSISHKPDGSADDGAKRNRITIKADSVQLSEVLKFIDSPLTMQGKASLDTSFDFFPAFDGQPEGEAKLSSKGLKILPGTIPTQLGPLPLPGFNWSQLQIKTHMAASNLFLDEVAFGSPKDPMSGRVKGQMNLRVEKTGPILGAYDLKVELNLNGSAEKDLETMLILLKDYRQATATGSKYVFRVTAQSGMAQPNLGRASSF